MKLSLAFLLAIGLVACIVCASSADHSDVLMRNKRGIGDFFRRLVGGGRRKNPQQPQAAAGYQQAQSYYPASSYYGGGQQQPEYLYGQASHANPMYQQQYAHVGDYVFPGHVQNQQQQQQPQQQQAESNQFAYGNYGSPQGGNGLAQAQQSQGQAQGQGQGANSDGPQPQYAFPPQYAALAQQQGYGHPGYVTAPAQQSQYQPIQGYNHHHQYANQFNHNNNQGPFQVEESSNQNSVSYQDQQADQQPQEQQQQSAHSGSPVVADQDGVSYAASAPQQQQAQYPTHYMAAGSAPEATYGGMAASPSYARPQYVPYGDRNQFKARPFGQNPGTIDVHQVLDSFIRSAGLSPQGDHENAKNDLAYAASGLKPVMSVKKLISYPFYFSSSGDKPTSYGNSIRRQSVSEDLLFNAALKQNLLASQKMDIPAAATETTAYSASSPAPSTKSPQKNFTPMVPASKSTADEESQFIANQAQALQEFLSHGKPNTSSSSSANSGASQSHYYYYPSASTSDASGTKDNKVASSSSSSSSSSAVAPSGKAE